MSRLSSGGAISELHIVAMDDWPGREASTRPVRTEVGGCTVAPFLPARQQQHRRLNKQLVIDGTKAVCLSHHLCLVSSMYITYPAR